MSSDIRQFRRAVALLKKRGLLKGRTKAGYPIDARSVTPGTVINGKKLSTIVAKYDDVVSGKVTPVTVSASTRRKFAKKAGFSTSQGKLLVPHGAGQTVTVRNDQVVIREASGIERVQIPIPFQNVRQYLRDIRKDAARINRMKRDNEYFGIRFFGNHRANFYGDIKFLLDDLEKYDSVLQATSRIKQEEIYDNLEILRIGKRARREWESSAGAARRRASKEYYRKRAKLQRKKLKRSPRAIQMMYAEKARLRAAAFRKRLRRDPSALKKYKAAAKKRAKKSQRKRK